MKGKRSCRYAALLIGFRAFLRFSIVEKFWPPPFISVKGQECWRGERQPANDTETATIENRRAFLIVGIASAYPDTPCNFHPDKFPRESSEKFSSRKQPDFSCYHSVDVYVETPVILLHVLFSSFVGIFDVTALVIFFSSECSRNVERNHVSFFWSLKCFSLKRGMRLNLRCLYYLFIRNCPVEMDEKGWRLWKCSAIYVCREYNEYLRLKLDSDIFLLRWKLFSGNKGF